MRAIVPGLETFKINKSIVGNRAKESFKKWLQPVIFLGPTLSREKAKEILDADYKSTSQKRGSLTIDTQAM